MSIGKSDGRNSSVEVSSSLLTLTCVQLTKEFLSAHKPAPTKENFIYFNIPQFRLSCKQCVWFKILIKETKVSIFLLGYENISKGDSLMVVLF